MNKEDYESASYGSPIQTLVAAATPEEARKLAEDMLKVNATRLHAEPYNIGFGAGEGPDGYEQQAQA